MMNIEELKQALRDVQLEAIAERKRKAEIKAEKEQAKRHKRQNKSKGGRPKLKPEVIEKAKCLAEKYTLCEVAFRLDIAVSSLYNHGISRNFINKEKIRNKLLKV